MYREAWIGLLLILLPGCSLNLQGRCWNCSADDVDQAVEIDENADLVVGDDDPLDDSLPEIMGDDDAVAPEEPEEEQPPVCNPADCPLECHATEPRCSRLMPSNYDPAGFYGKIAGGLGVAEWDTVTVNTNEGSIIGTSGTVYRPAWSQGQAANGIFWDLVSQDLERTLSIFGMTYLTLPANARIIVIGTYPVAFYVTGGAWIAGKIEARAQGLQPGPGGGAGGVRNGESGQACWTDSHGKGGGQGGSGTGQIEAGGGGGGGLGSGGKGGNVGDYSPYNDISGGFGGVPVLAGVALIPLTGGCGGGAGGGPDTAGNYGYGGDGGYSGGGGGAVQISACGAITIDPGGGIDAAGAGGQCGLYGGGGGGGGAGGSILLEAASITNGGLLAANGGGGGTGGYSTDVMCQESGSDGGYDMNQAEGGTASDYGADGGGGAGGGGSVIDGQGGVSYYNGGGGGGAAGRIRFNYFSSIGSGSCSPFTVSINHNVPRW